MAKNSTPLRDASDWGHTECVKLLIERRAEIEAASHTGTTALTVASWRGHFDCVRVLLEARADIDKQMNNGDTCLISASYNGHEKVVRFLLESYAKVNIRGEKDKTALQWAGQKGHFRIASLLESVRDIVWSPDTHRQFPAAFKRSVLVLLVLHRVSSSSDGQLQPCHADASNRFWKLPKPLLLCIIALNAPFRLTNDQDQRW